MFYDPLSRRVIDYVGGQADLRRRIIRAIGEPARRLAEDHLRMVRAVRFAVQLQFRIEPQTHRAIQEHAGSVRRVSAERIREELELVLAEPRRADGLHLLAQTGLLQHLWPGDDWPAARIPLARAALATLPRRCSFELALAATLMGLAPKRADRICRDLACSNQVRNAVVWLLQQQPALDDPRTLSLADVKLLMQHDHFGDLLALLRARLAAQHRPQGPYRQIRRRAAAVEPESIRPQPLLNGHDLMAMGLKPGPLFKKLLDAVYRAQLDEEVPTKDDALRLVRQMANPR
jgi:poly(A) polymerase